MARVSKPPEERKKEIVDTAAKIFEDKGYENTSISDIVKSINVAQGTFYYYFKSKEGLIEPVVEFIMNKSLAEVEAIINTEKPALEKIRLVILNRMKFLVEKEKMVGFIWGRKNNFMFEKFKSYAIPKVLPVFKKLILQGEREGVLKVDYPDETIKIMVITFFDLFMYYREKKDKENITREEFLEKLNAIENILKRLLGIGENIKIYFADEIIKLIYCK